MVSRIIPVEEFDLIIFGGTGDLARRKILPGLFKRFADGQMPQGSRIIAAARSEMNRAEFQAFTKEAVLAATDESETSELLAGFIDALDYVMVDALGVEGWEELAGKMRGGCIRAFYFSVSPSLFDDLAKRLHDHNMVDPDTRIVVEKPFGRDLETARALNQQLAARFDETQIYRIDHYLGKETVQNLMAVRFGNMLFEPLWNSQYIDHIQITVAEEVGVEGRGSYYDHSGAMRDMLQNHLMQLLCLTAMEAPAKFEPDTVRDEKLKVIRALGPVEPHHMVRGQYAETEDEKGFREDAENPQSRTESYIALKCEVQNWRWAGTPFYLRTGKRLAARSSEIIVVFKSTPHSIFGPDAGEHHNELRIQLQPNEGITLKVTIKEPGPGGMRLLDVPLDMSFAEALGPDADAPDAYERLIMDVMRGNQTLFMRDDEVEAAWAWTDPIIQGWEARHDVPKPYDSYSQGPTDAKLLIQRDGREWRDIKV